MVKVALVSTYELGHQPVHLASPAAALRSRGHEVTTLDLAAEPWNDRLMEWADVAAFSVPMHTALRLASLNLRRVRKQENPPPVAAYGLYAASAPVGGPEGFDRAIGGEYETELTEWVESLGTDHPAKGATISRGRSSFAKPDREGLPDLSHYAHLEYGDSSRLVGAVEASHGCLHRCRHCPLPTVYDGRFRAVPRPTVLADIEQLVVAGAQHITFADADFLNGPVHSRRIVEQMHSRWPHLTYDATIKVEHLLAHPPALDWLAETGCLFIVSAFETLNDRILKILDKGHTATQAATAVHAVREVGLEIHPTWLPFTPWTMPEDVAEIFSFVSAHDLVGITDPVQLSIRLLVPHRSLLSDHPEFVPHRGEYDPVLASYRWSNPDPAVDRLAGRLTALAEAGTGQKPAATFAQMRRVVLKETGGDPSLADAIPANATEGRPRLTEPWFC